MRFCKFVPDDILKKLGDKDSTIKPDVDLSEFFQEKRQFLQKNPERKSALKRKYHKVTHREIRRLFDSKNSYSFTTEPIAVDEQINSAAPSKHESLEYANKIYDYFDVYHHIESYDDNNGPIDVHVNFGKNYNNAFWDGLKMVFGNGDGKYFNTFLSQNIFSHELGHAITEYMVDGGGLKYQDQQGALNEHYSDVWAVCIDQKLKFQKPTQASWIIGEGLFTSRIPGKGLRTFKNEKAYSNTVIGSDPQPKHFKDFAKLPNNEDGDYGGVHINSGIPNRAFYEFCILAETEVGDEKINYSWRAPADIWFQTYKRLNPNSQFKEFALDTISITKRIHPQLVNQIQKAWKLVGVL